MAWRLSRLVASTVAGTVAMALAAALTCEPASAQGSDPDFYKGKVVRIIVPTPPGGLYDIYSRMLGQHMPRHLQGAPTFILQHMGGAAGLVSANYMANLAPRDGTAIAAAYSAAMTAPLLSPGAAKFDIGTLAWIGSITKDPFVAYVWNTARAKTLEELKTQEILVGGTAVGSAPIDYAILAKNLFGLKLKIVTGYSGTSQVNLAMQRGEIEGTFGFGWNSLKSGQPDWLKERQVVIVTQFGATRHPELPDVPAFAELVRNEADRQALGLYLPRQEYSRPYYAPPGLPTERLTALRRAFDATIADPEFLAEARKLKAPVESPAKGEDMAAAAALIAKTPPDVVRRVVDMFANFRADK